MIRLAGRSVSLGGREVLHAVDFAAGAGEFVALCGPNGAGKTTMLKAAAGLLLGGTTRPLEVAYVEQGARCAWGLTVREVAALGRVAHGDRDMGPVDRALADCGLAALGAARVDRISGGQARRAMLARALAGDPTVLLLDEPVADLDPAAAHDIMALLATFAAKGGLVVAVLHAVELALRYASRMVVLDGGRIVADGTPLAVLPDAARSFGLGWGTVSGPGLMPPRGGKI